jgi:hypothetical protein
MSFRLHSATLSHQGEIAPDRTLDRRESSTTPPERGPARRARAKLLRLGRASCFAYRIRHGAIVHAPTKRFCCSSLDAGHVGRLSGPTWPP